MSAPAFDPLEPMMASVLSGARRWWVEHGDSLYALRCLPDECIDSCVCDPPYHRCVAPTYCLQAEGALCQVVKRRGGGFLFHLLGNGT